LTSIRKKTRRISKRSFLFKKYIYKRLAKASLKAAHLATVRKKHKLVRSGHIYIRLRRINTFLTMMTDRKKGIFTLSTGALKYNGRKKSSAFAREHVARKFAQKLLKKHYRFVDVHFVSKIGKFYRFI